MSEKLNVAEGVTEASATGEWLNVPNLFTALRVLLAPPIILLLLYRPRLPYNVSVDVFAGIIFIAAALTDKADGYFARRNNQVTKVGQFLDPLADKLLMLPMLVTLWYVGMSTAEGGSVTLDSISLFKPTSFPLWVLLIVLARELLISGIRIVGAMRSISFPASWSGKIKMFSQIIVVSVLIFFPGSANNVAVHVLVYAMAAITAYSGVDYVMRARREIWGKTARGADGSK